MYAKLIKPLLKSIKFSLKRELHKLRNYSKEPILVLGDSYSSIFRSELLCHDRFYFDLVCVEGATVSGIKNPNSQTQAKPIFDKAIKRSKAEQCCVLLGEVDMGFTIWLRAESKSSDIELVFEDVVRKYIDFVTNVARSHKTYCISAPLPTIRDGQNWGEIANLRSSIKATQKERTELTVKFNKTIEDRLINSDVTFLNFDEESLSENGLIAAKLLNDNSLDHHYNTSEYAKMVSSKLMKLLNNI